MLTALCDAIIFTGEAMVEGHALMIRDGVILDIVGNRKIPVEARKKSYPDVILAPGFIDAQVNGGGNVLFNNTPTAEACLKIAEAHRKFGTTSLLPTVITDTPEVLQRAIAAMRTARKTYPGILGLHIEGPHLSPAARGVHKDAHIRPLTDADLEIYKPAAGEVMMITVAPENVTPTQIKQLRDQGVIVALGHTDAAPDVMRAAFAAGASGFTHIFNGSKPGSKDGGKIPAPAQAALDDRASWCSLIADGYHVSAEWIKLALKTKPRGKVFLVSDAMAPAADNPQPFRLYGETISYVRENGAAKCVTAEGKLAGSAITMLDAVRHCVKNVGVELDEALRMASTYPAAALGLDTKLGKLLPGYKGDAIAVSPDLRLKSVIFN